MNEDTVAELNKAAHDLITVLSGFTEQEFNTFPGPEKWSAGQMSQHVLKSITAFDKVLTSPSKKTERAPDEMFPKLREIFLDFSTKLKSPDFIVPDGTVFAKGEILQSLTDKFDRIAVVARDTDLTEIPSVKIPALGDMTKLEAVYFVTVHTQRHIHQAKNIYSQVQALN